MEIIIPLRIVRAEGGASIEEIEDLALARITDVVAVGNVVEEVGILTGEIKEKTDLILFDGDNKILAAGAGDKIVLPVMQARVYTAAAQFGQEVRVPQLSTPTVSFQFTGDYTGNYSDWTARFGAKQKLTDESYIISLKENITLTYDPQTNTTHGLIDLDKTDTAAVHKKLYAEVEINKNGKTHKPYMFYLTIYEVVIK